jgi:hypothetical protein
MIAAYCQLVHDNLNTDVSATHMVIVKNIINADDGAAAAARMACGHFEGHTLSTQKQARAGNTWSPRPKAPIEMMQTGAKLKDEERIYGSTGLRWGRGGGCMRPRSSYSRCIHWSV